MLTTYTYFETGYRVTLELD
jgi:hypothetical protein